MITEPNGEFSVLVVGMYRALEKLKLIALYVGTTEYMTNLSRLILSGTGMSCLI